MSPPKPCRLCGTNDGVIISILEPAHTKYLAKISNLLNIVISVEDPLPKVLCHRCVVKIDDFELFLEDARRTQIQLKQIYQSCDEPPAGNPTQPLMRQDLNNSMYNYPLLAYDNEIETLRPPAITQFNLLTCSTNSNENLFTNPGTVKNLKSSEVVNRVDEGSIDNEKSRPFNPASSTLITSRRGSRPFPKKLMQRSDPSSHQQDRSMVETDSEKKDGHLEVLSAEESNPETCSSVNSSPAIKRKKQKKYQSPFCAPTRRRKRGSHMKQYHERKRQEKEKKGRNSSDEEIGPLAEEDLQKYFILTKVPDVGTIYTCMGCETILTSSKAACNHTKCIKKSRIVSDEEESSSSSESSDPEPSDTRGCDHKYIPPKTVKIVKSIRHNLTHNRSDTTTEKETIYSCQFCDKPFTRNVVRLQHERIHLLDLSDTDEDYTYTSRRPKKKDFNRSMVEQFFIR